MVHVSICVTLSFRHFSFLIFISCIFLLHSSFSCVSVLYVFILCRLFTRISSYTVVLHICPARPLSPVDTFTPFTVDVATNKYRPIPWQTKHAEAQTDRSLRHVKMIRSAMVKCDGSCSTHWKDNKCVQQFLGRKLKAKISFERSKRKWEDNVKWGS
jgi:hypothetical protein